MIYQEIKGKASRGEQLKTITNKEIVALYFERIGRKVATVPQQGITPDTLKLKKYFLGIWLQFIELLGFEKTPINRPQLTRGRGFGQWFANLPEKSERTGPRPVEQINNSIAEMS